MAWSDWSKTRRGCVGCLGFTVIGFALIVAAGLANQRAMEKLPPDLRTATISARQTAHPAKPTRTPKPTRTMGSTATEAPVETAEPTEARTPTVEVAATTAIDPAVTEYANWVRGQLGNMQAPIKGAGEAFTELGQTPAIMFTDEWKTKLALALGFIQAYSGELKSHPAPAGATSAKAVAMTVADYLEEGCTLVTEAIDSMDPDKLKRGMAKFGAAGAMMEDLNAELVKLGSPAP